MISLTGRRDVLRPFQQAGVLSVADVHTAASVCRLGGENADTVVLAVAVAVRELRHGSVCVELDRWDELVRELSCGSDDPASAELQWPAADAVLDALRASPLVTGSPHGPLRPLHVIDSDGGPLLYVDRYLRQENIIRAAMAGAEAARPAVDAIALGTALPGLFAEPDGSPTPAPDRQRVAAVVAATTATTILTGGPGTGKTYTVARILALLQRLHGPDLRMAMCAPTGKAAAILGEAVATQAAPLGLADPPAAVTVHRLLGLRRDGRARFGPANPLRHDVVVVDETSMMSLTLMAALMSALRPGARLILVGDPDQLSSVDAGAVLADLVHRPSLEQQNPVLQQVSAHDLDAQAAGEEPPIDPAERAGLARGVVRLRRGHRFDSAISALADAVREGRAADALAVLAAGDDVELLEAADSEALRVPVVEAGQAVQRAAEDGDGAAALAALGRHRLLCAHRDGPAGQARWAATARDWIAEATGQRWDGDDIYPGQPLLITANDYDLAVFNGDIGVVIRDGEHLAAVIERGGDPLLVEPAALADVQTAYAMTVHRSQGSQYDSVSIILPGPESPLLTRQLLYTAITRARHRVRILGDPEAVAAAVQRQARRASGLQRVLAI